MKLKLISFANGVNSNSIQVASKEFKPGIAASKSGSEVPHPPVLNVPVSGPAACSASPDIKIIPS